MLTYDNIIMKTKKEILKTARKLFNEYGYANTSMRDISNALNMTVGNLTYHFKKKHDIFFALMNEIELAEPQALAVSLLDFHKLIAELLEGMVKNRFFFSDFKLFATIEGSVSPLVKNEKFLRLAVKQLSNLQTEGFFNDFNESRMISTMRICLLAHLAWISDNPDSNDQKNFLFDHWQLLMPYFTEKGWQCYQQEIEPLLR